MRKLYPMGKEDAFQKVPDKVYVYYSDKAGVFSAETDSKRYFYRKITVQNAETVLNEFKRFLSASSGRYSPWLSYPEAWVTDDFIAVDNTENNVASKIISFLESTDCCTLMSAQIIYEGFATFLSDPEPFETIKIKSGFYEQGGTDAVRKIVIKVKEIEKGFYISSGTIKAKKYLETSAGKILFCGYDRKALTAIKKLLITNCESLLKIVVLFGEIIEDADDNKKRIAYKFFNNSVEIFREEAGSGKFPECAYRLWLGFIYGYGLTGKIEKPI